MALTPELSETSYWLVPVTVGSIAVSVAGDMNMLTLLPGANTSPTILAVTLWSPLTIVYMSPTASDVSLRNSVLTSTCAAAEDCAYQLPEISCRLDQAGLPSP